MINLQKSIESYDVILLIVIGLNIKVKNQRRFIDYWSEFSLIRRCLRMVINRLDHGISTINTGNRMDFNTNIDFMMEKTHTS